MSFSAKACAEAVAIERLLLARGGAIFRDHPRGYTSAPDENLVPGVARRDYWDDLSGGDGNELVDKPGKPAKFCAAYSSSALAVNAFGPFRHAPEQLQLAGQDGFSEARFERKCPTGLKGNSPNLDFYAAGPAGTVCVESKFLEPLSPKEAKFRPSYERKVEQLAEPGWQAIYRLLCSEPGRFIHLDAAQLVKHYLGMRHSLSGTGGTLTLLYLYWEPTNAREIPEYQRHRQEAAEFSEAVAESEIRFMAQSYPELWEHWLAESPWPGMPKHIAALRARYEYSL